MKMKFVYILAGIALFFKNVIPLRWDVQPIGNVNYKRHHVYYSSSRYFYHGKSSC